MNTSILVALILTILALASQTFARQYRIPNSYEPSYVEWLRGKRQSHPDATIARIPEIPFADSPRQVPELSEYLTPPAIDSTPRNPQSVPINPQNVPFNPQNGPTGSQSSPIVQSAPTSQNQGKWELGFDASDILVPPMTDDQALAAYNSLKVGSLDNNNNNIDGPLPNPQDYSVQGLFESFGPEPSSAGNSPVGKFVENYSPEFRPSPEETKQPVYSFVKTDPHGHFKWGVHLGGN